MLRSRSKSPANKVRPSVDLQVDRISVPYRLRLGQAKALFERWLERHGLRLTCLLTDVAQLNRCLVSFIKESFDAGESEWIGRYAILAIQNDERSLKGKLRQAWDSIFTWELKKKLFLRY